jgi:hypothetical protein
MPQIIVAADRGAAFGEGAVMLRETVNVADFESQHFAAQLVERLGWAVEDANRAEQAPPDRARTRKPKHDEPTSGEPNDDEPIESPEPQREERVIAQSPA